MSQSAFAQLAMSRMYQSRDSSAAVKKAPYTKSKRSNDSVSFTKKGVLKPVFQPFPDHLRHKPSVHFAAPVTDNGIKQSNVTNSLLGQNLSIPLGADVEMSQLSELTEYSQQSYAGSHSHPFVGTQRDSVGQEQRSSSRRYLSNQSVSSRSSRSSQSASKQLFPSFKQASANLRSSNSSQVTQSTMQSSASIASLFSSQYSTKPKALPYAPYRPRSDQNSPENARMTKELVKTELLKQSAEFQEQYDKQVADLNAKAIDVQSFRETLDAKMRTMYELEERAKTRAQKLDSISKESTDKLLQSQKHLEDFGTARNDAETRLQSLETEAKIRFQEQMKLLDLRLDDIVKRERAAVSAHDSRIADLSTISDKIENMGTQITRTAESALKQLSDAPKQLLNKTLPLLMEPIAKIVFSLLGRSRVNAELTQRQSTTSPQSLFNDSGDDKCCKLSCSNSPSFVQTPPRQKKRRSNCINQVDNVPVKRRSRRISLRSIPQSIPQVSQEIGDVLFGDIASINTASDLSRSLNTVDTFSVADKSCVRSCVTPTRSERPESSLYRSKNGSTAPSVRPRRNFSKSRGRAKFGRPMAAMEDSDGFLS